MSLIDDVITVVNDEIPVNPHCTYCDTDLPIETIIDTGSDRDMWRKMAIKVIQTVATGLNSSIVNHLETLTEYEIKNL